MCHASTVLRRSAVTLVTFVALCFCALVLPAEVWADPPTPVPAPTSGQFVPGSWSCTDRWETPTPDPTLTPTPTPSKVGEDCAVSQWAPVPGDTAPASSSLACGASPSPSTSSTSSASPSPSPTDSASPAASSGSAAPCLVQVSDAQVAPFVWVGGGLLLISVASFVLTYSRRFRRVVA